MAEENRCEQSSAPRLCANNCGFFGSGATLDLCSKCYRDHCLKEQQRENVEKLLSQTSPKVSFPPLQSSSSSSTASVQVQTSLVSATEAAVDLVTQQAVVAEPVPVVESSSKGPTRCGACRKRVGLTGFKCRCGVTFCGSHRYAEQHDCSFDFKSAGKDAIAKANPVIKADKIDRI